jgi:hypothetical protein
MFGGKIAETTRQRNPEISRIETEMNAEPFDGRRPAPSPAHPLKGVDSEVQSSENAEVGATPDDATLILDSNSVPRITIGEESNQSLAVLHQSQPSVNNDSAGDETCNEPDTSSVVSNSQRIVQTNTVVNQTSHQNGNQTSSNLPGGLRPKTTAHSTTTPADPDGRDLVSSTPRLSNRDKLGICAILLFSIGTVIILAALGMLWFLWAADQTNNLWHEMMARDWLTKVVNITSEAIKLAVNFQIGSEVAMLASIALENFAVLFPHAASLSMMKACAGSGTVLILLKHQLTGVFKRRARATVLVCVLVVLLSIVYAITQFFSVLLISDTAIRPIRGLSQTVNTSIGFSDGAVFDTIGPEDSMWLRVPTVYPAFAEYTEPPFEADGVLDTGVCLRAFLPFRDADSRQAIQAYDGPTIVIDARVTCQRPIFSDISVTNGALTGFINVVGQVSPSPPPHTW